MDDGIDILDLLTSDEPTARRKSQAMVRALRREKAAGMLGVASGDPVLGQLGGRFLSDAGEGQKELAQAPVARLRYALEAQKAKQAEAQQKAMQDPRTGAAMRGMAGAYGQDLQDVPAEALPSLLPLASQAHNARLSQERVDQDQWTPTGKGTSGRLNKKTGAFVPFGGGAPAKDPTTGEPMPAGFNKPKQEALQKLDEALNSYKGKGGGEMVKLQGRVHAAERVFGLGLDEKGLPKNLTRNEMTEMAQSVATLISTGGVATEHLVNEMTPHSAGLDLSQRVQYLLGRPEEANTKEFIKRLGFTAKREREIAIGQLLEGMKKALPGHAETMRAFPNETAQIVRSRIGSYEKELSNVPKEHGGALSHGTSASSGTSVKVLWKGKHRSIPADKLADAIAAGAEEVK